ncbi:MAG: hypothetical protein ACPGJS_12070 [Flammeovirgaceae bacterium]
MVDKNQVAGIFDSHAEAVKALQYLQDEGYPIDKNMSIVGHGEVVEDHLHLYSAVYALKITAVFGAIIGAVLGALIGLELLMFPGTELIPLGGAPMGILTGVGFGVVAGAIIGMTIAFLIGERGVLRRKKHFEMTDYVLVVNDTADEVRKVRELLGTEDEFENESEEAVS